MSLHRTCLQTSIPRPRPGLEIVLYALKILEGMRRVLLCILEAVEGELYLLEVLEGDALCATLYAGGCCGAQFRCFEISIVTIFSLLSATERIERNPLRE